MSWRLAHLPLLLWVNGAVLVAAAVVGGLVRGWTGAAGATAGVAVVMASYLLSTLLIAWADRVSPQLVFPVGLTAYLVKFTVLGFVMFAVIGSGWPGVDPLRAGVVAGVLAWTSSQIWWVVRHPPALEYHPPAPTGLPPAGAAGSPRPPAAAPPDDRTRG